jgi:glycerophosphoryl diester phosphodiesterase
VSDHRFPSDAFPAIVAHRGASSTRPENTISSFAEALLLGSRILELDVRLSKDGVAVVMHDATVDRTTDGIGAVHELDARAIAALNAGTPEAPEAPPTLAEVLDLASGRAALALEIKNLPGEPGFESRERIVETTHAELGRTAFEGPVLVVSFNPASVAASKALDPSIPTGFLSTGPIPAREALAFAAAAGHDLVLPGTRSLVPLGEAFVGEAHASGLRVGTWTADDPDEIRMLLGWGVDAIASNDPAMALGVLAER